MLASTKCTWYFNEGFDTIYGRDELFDWNIYPNTDLQKNHNGLFGWMPIIEFHGPEEEWDLKPTFLPENDSTEEDEKKTVKFDYLTATDARNRTLSP